LSSTLFVRTSSMNLPRCHKLPPGNGVFFFNSERRIDNIESK